jgi:hypothetical protein
MQNHKATFAVFLRRVFGVTSMSRLCHSQPRKIGQITITSKLQPMLFR